MKYENAKDILPEELLIEVRKYAAGKLLYVPSGDEKKTWGEASGFRETLKKRNQMICNKYAYGKTISELANEYFLSLDSIQKIIYSKRKYDNLKYEPTLASAVAYASAGMMEEWIQSFLLLSCTDEGAHKPSFDAKSICFGVARLPLRFIETGELKLVNTENYEKSELELPPLVVKYEGGKFYIVARTEMFVALKQLKKNAYPAFIWISDNAEYKTFMRNYGIHLRYVDKV